MCNHLRSVREGAMKRTNLWDGTQPASVFMLKWLVFVDLPRTRPRQIDPLAEPKRDESRSPLPYFKKTSSFVLIWPESLPGALCIPCHAFLVLSSADLYSGTGHCVACLAWSAVEETAVRMQEFHPSCHSDSCFVSSWLLTDTHINIS